MTEESQIPRAPERGRSGCRYLLIGLTAFFFAAVIFILGLTTGGGTLLVDRILGGFGLVAQPAPTPTFVSGDAIVTRIQAVQRLETTIYTVERVIEARQSDPRWPDWLRGDRLLFIAHGRIVAGVDLEKVTAQDVVIAPGGGAVTVTLPAVEIFNRDSILDNAQSRVYDRQQGLLAPPNVDLERQARQAAEAQLLAAACADGILTRATEDAQRAVGRLLQLLDMQVTVQTTPPPACG